MPCSIFFHHSVPFLISLNLLFRTIKSRHFVLRNICFKLHLLHTLYDFSVQGDLQSMLIIRTPKWIGNEELMEKTCAIFEIWRKCFYKQMRQGCHMKRREGTRVSRGLLYTGAVWVLTPVPSQEQTFIVVFFLLHCLFSGKDLGFRDTLRTNPLG